MFDTVETVFDGDVDPALVERSLADEHLRVDVARHRAARVSAPVRVDHLRPAGRRRRLHRTVDRTARRTARSGPAHRADRGQSHRLGRVGSQRRIRRRQPDPRPRERKDALAQRDRPTHGDGHGEPRRHAGRDRADSASTSNGSAPACSRSRPNRIRWRGSRRPRPRGRANSSTATEVRARGPFADLPGRAVRRRHVRDRAPRQARLRTGPRVHRGRRAHLRAHQRDVARLRRRGAAASTPTAPSSPPGRSCSRPTSSRHLLRRNRFHTVPVYDYVLSTEPLTDAQLRPHRLAEPAGNRRLRQPVPLLPAQRRTTGSCGAATTPSTTSAARSTRPTRIGPRPTAGWPSTSSSPSRSSTTSASATGGQAPSTPTPGSVRTGAWPATDRVAYVNGFTGLGVGAARFAADVCLDLLEGRRRPRTELEMVRKRPLPFPPEPLGQHRNPGHPVVARPCRSLRGHGATLCCARSTPSASASTPSTRQPRAQASNATDCSPTVLLRAEPNPPRTRPGVSKLESASHIDVERVNIVGDRLQNGEKLEVGQSLDVRATGRTR